MNKNRYRAAIEETIANAKGSRSLETVKASDGATVYAYPKSHGRIAWSVNARECGLSILRGIPPPRWRGRSRTLIAGHQSRGVSTQSTRLGRIEKHTGL